MLTIFIRLYLYFLILSRSEKIAKMIRDFYLKNLFQNRYESNRNRKNKLFQ
jgi:hypothetical protein